MNRGGNSSFGPLWGRGSARRVPIVGFSGGPHAEELDGGVQTAGKGLVSVQPLPRRFL